MNELPEDKLARLERQLALYADDLAVAVRGRDEVESAYKALSKQLVSYGQDFRQVYDELAEQLKKTKVAYLEIIHRLVLAAEFKDEDTGDHIERMSRYSAIMAKTLSFSANEVENVLYASPMHDVGKIGIPDRILLKPGRLSDAEFEVMRKHTTYGARILERSDSEIIQLAHTIALNHHEKWNGTGYPSGLQGEGIPLVARVVKLADVFDAMTSRRPYKDAYPIDVAVQVIKAERGESFDPDVVDVFISNLDAILEVRKEIDRDEPPDPQTFTLSERDRADGLEVDGFSMNEEKDT